MASRNRNTPEQVAPARSEPVTLGPDAGGGNVLAAWRGLHELFGAQVERFDVTPDGVVAVNLSFDSNDPILEAITTHGDKNVSRRLDLISLYPYVIDPENVAPYDSANEMTTWMVNFTKGAGDGDGSRSPQFVKDRIATYKAGRNIAAPRGRKRRILRLDELSEIRPETLDDVAVEELESLQATIAAAMAKRNSDSAVATV